MYRVMGSLKRIMYILLYFEAWKGENLTKSITCKNLTTTTYHTIITSCHNAAWSLDGCIALFPQEPGNKASCTPKWSICTGKYQVKLPLSTTGFILKLPEQF